MRYLATTLLFSALSAAFSLSSLEPVSESDLTPACFKAYDADIEACADGPCSDDCLDAAPEIAAKLRKSCANDFVGMDSLLRRTLDGGLAERLCVENEESDSQNDYRIVLSTLEAAPLSTSEPEALSTTIYAPTATAAPGEEEDEEEAPGILKDPLESSTKATITAAASSAVLELDNSVPTTLSSLTVPGSVIAASASASSSAEPSSAPENSGATHRTPLTGMVAATLILAAALTW